MKFLARRPTKQQESQLHDTIFSPKTAGTKNWYGVLILSVWINQDEKEKQVQSAFIPIPLTLSN